MSFFQRPIWTFLFFIIYSPTLFAAPEKIAIGTDHVCKLADGSLKCFGSNQNDMATVPAGILNVQDVAVTWDGTCALDEEGVKCWGKSFAKPYSKITGLKRPKKIEMAFLEACAIDDDGVKCWYIDSPEKKVLLPSIKGAKALAMGDGKTCIIDSEGTKCWGYNWEKPTRAPSDVINPFKISVTNSEMACALGKNGVQCIGSYTPAYPPHDLKNPSDISIGDFHACAIEASEVRCWGEAPAIPHLVNPRLVEVRDGKTCVLHESGFSCFGDLEVNE